MITRLVFLFGIVFYLIFNVNEKFLNLDYFKIKKINVSGNAKIFNEELTLFTKKIYNKNKYKIDFNKIEKELNKDLRIEKALILDEGVNEITVLVNERKPSFYVAINNKIYLMDKNGNIFGYYKESNKEGLPILVLGDKNNNEKILDLLSILEETTLKNIVSQLYFVDDNKIEMYLSDGTKIITNNDVTKDKYDVVEVLYSSLSSEKKIEYIDLRFENYIIKYLGENQ